MRMKDNKMQVWAHYCEMERSLNNYGRTTHDDMADEDRPSTNVSRAVVNKTMMYGVTTEGIGSSVSVSETTGHMPSFIPAVF